jgi:hypothetical protein
MPRCPHCDYPVPDDRERVGARCPNCRDPLYEPALRFSRRAREGEASCAMHPGMESVSVCARCNQHLCEACRTRWRNVIICAACVDRALASGEARPMQTTSAAQQTRAGVLLGVGAWVVAGVGWAMLRAVSGSDSDVATICSFLSVLMLAGAVPLATAGVGQSVAALRVPNDRGWLAGTALVLCGTYVGLLLGLGTLALWQA